MGIWDAITDLIEAATPWTTAEAEAPAAQEEQKEEQEAATETKDEAKDEQPESESAEEQPAEEEAAEEEEDEEDEEEIVDPKEKFEEECKESKQCAPAKHHFDECVDRVTNASGDSEVKEDCVEEFFHLAHCASQCAAPKLWSVLK
ncbi:ubiquinol-cytochrome c reductase complex 17 kd protein [Diplogelasinospora grovesii]|uniref:Cytochrome b-c1 complex subunit 6, mitochondrial n=1 Tax=Diplogelasinospora grovesii TaxID=303347 RepID=A0AAN6N4Z1_9PEZI|nr:ubiquinol-cytochrome c reductase complex 17 kd protein [Diplogelasinospora grovesii]